MLPSVEVLHLIIGKRIIIRTAHVPFQTVRNDAKAGPHVQGGHEVDAKQEGGVVRVF
jgi:hypothetical protein